MLSACGRAAGSKVGADKEGQSGELSQGQFSHGVLQGVAGPVVVVPAQEPARERRWLEALLDLHDGCPAISVGRVCLDVPGRWRERLEG